MTRMKLDFTDYHARGAEPEFVSMPAREEAWCRLRREKLASGEWRLSELEERYEVFCLFWNLYQVEKSHAS